MDLIWHYISTSLPVLWTSLQEEKCLSHEGESKSSWILPLSNALFNMGVGGRQELETTVLSYFPLTLISFQNSSFECYPIRNYFFLS